MYVCMYISDCVCVIIYYISLSLYICDFIFFGGKQNFLANHAPPPGAIIFCRQFNDVKWYATSSEQLPFVEGKPRIRTEQLLHAWLKPESVDTVHFKVTQ